VLEEELVGSSSLNSTLPFAILGTGEVAATPAPSLTADGDRYSPLAEPDLDGELDAHGILQSGCRSGFASVISLCHHFGGCASENHHFGGKKNRTVSFAGLAVFLFRLRRL
jgi:hypothetical protein